MYNELIVPFLIAAFIHILRHVVLLILPLREFLRWRGWRAAAFLAVSILLAAALSHQLIVLAASPYTRFLASCCGLVCTCLICLCCGQAFL